MGYFSAITGHASAYQLPTASDAQLVALAQHGEPAAYAELCRRHRKMIFRTVMKIIGNVDDAEDVLQDAWMSAFVHIRSFDGKSAFSTWMTRIAINFSLAMLRKRRRQKEFSLDSPVDPDNYPLMQIIELSSNPEERCIESERQRLVRQAIRRLPSKLRAAIEIRGSQDESINELALVAGVSVPAMKSRLMRARLRLRERLKKTLKQNVKIHLPSGRLVSDPAQDISRHRPPVAGSGMAVRKDSVGRVDPQYSATNGNHSDEVRMAIEKSNNK